MGTKSNTEARLSRPGPDAEFREALEAGRFIIQHCETCAEFTFYPRTLCPNCGSLDLTWVEPCGGGTVYASTTIRHSLGKGGAYNVSIIELDEGPRLLSRVEDIDVEDVHIGMPVAVRIDRLDGLAILQFVPDKDSVRSG